MPHYNLKSQICDIFSLICRIYFVRFRFFFLFCYSCCYLCHSHSHTVPLSCVCNVYVCVFCFVCFISELQIVETHNRRNIRTETHTICCWRIRRRRGGRRSKKKSCSATFIHIHVHVQGGSVTITITVTTTSTTSTKMSQTFPIHFMCNFCYLTTNRSKKLFSRLRRTLGKHKSHDRKITIAHNKNVERTTATTATTTKNREKEKQNKTHDKIIRSVIYKREKTPRKFELLIVCLFFDTDLI